MSKRGNGEGSIYKRLDGRWTASVTLGYEDGKRNRKTIYAKTRTEVAKRLNELHRSMEQGLPVSTPDRLTLGDYLSDWLENSARPKIRESTYTGYEVQVRLHIVPTIGHLRLGKLTALQLQSYYRQQTENGLGPRSIQMQHKLIKQALGQAVRWNLIVRNVAELVEGPRVPHKMVQHFTLDQAKAFLDAVKGDRLYALYAVTTSCGLRRGEVLALKWDDIDLSRGSLAVKHTLAKVKGGWQLLDPKTHMSRRVVKLPAFVVEALKQHKSRQLEERRGGGTAWEETGFVFTTLVGSPIDGNNMHHAYKAHLKRAGLPLISFHALRHSAATLMLALGVQPKVVAEML